MINYIIGFVMRQLNMIN